MNNWKKTIKTLKTSSKGSLDKPTPSSLRSESPGAQCGIGSIVEFEFDGQLLTGTVAAFGRYRPSRSLGTQSAHRRDEGTPGAGRRDRA